MSHIFISPHPDDAALSCGGLIAHLRELGQNVIIISVFSGHGDLTRMSSYQQMKSRCLTKLIVLMQIL
jgi:LmbE family N-acetylglucosaminyl deacetylase